MQMQKILLTLILSLFYFNGEAQVVSGTINDAASLQPLDFVTVFVRGENIASESKIDGSFSIEVSAGQSFELVFRRVGYEEKGIDLGPLLAGDSIYRAVTLNPSDRGLEFELKADAIDEDGLIREDSEAFKRLPTASGNLESVLPHIALGANSGSGGELSSQYQVRGGNYDENLVYINDFEIYRPQLIRAGQQEGLTFPNADLIRDLSFSSGGYAAKYGDKLSSVLDIKYKRPNKFKSSVSMSLLGGSTHIEGSRLIGGSKYKRFRYLVGARFKTTTYLLGSLDLSGEYNPSFTDIQGYFTFDITKDLQLGYLSNYNRSVYQFQPNIRSTAIGLIDFSLQLYSEFEGQEVDDFTNYTNGLSLTYVPDRDKNPYFLKLLASRYTSDENERFDILGFYSLREIEADFNSSNFGEVLGELGSGTQHLYARNSFNAQVTNIQHKGGIEFQLEPKDESKETSHFLLWGVKYQNEQINDRINEWERLDSAGYSLNYDTSEVLLYYVLKSENELRSDRLFAYIQDTYSWYKEDKGELKLTAGVRLNHWTLNKETFVSPRMQFLYKPLNRKKNISYRLAAGYYFQPAFYRELRRLDGSLNSNLSAQKSAHLVGGFTYDFNPKRFGGNDFRFIMEAYYKKLWDLVSYDVDNVKIRYSGLNDASGYVTGIDFRLNGNFVKGAESWFNLSFLRARESLDDVQHMIRELGSTEGTEVNDVPRPTDRLMNMSIFFQDYLPNNENFKMNLNLSIGTGLPFGLKDNNLIYRNTYRFRPYHRVDIGFAYQLFGGGKVVKNAKHPLRFTENAWISLEVFNMMNTKNEASRTWIKTVFKQQYAIPNFLTSRRLNVRMRFDF
jgi:hypothetical protein